MILALKLTSDNHKAFFDVFCTKRYVSCNVPQNCFLLVQWKEKDDDSVVLRPKNHNYPQNDLFFKTL